MSLGAMLRLAREQLSSQTWGVLLARCSSICASILLALLCVTSRAALDPGYSIQIFQTEQGLPQNNINSIIQSRAGYLWLATFGGLTRFDGVRFKVFDSANTPALANSRITALFEDARGVMWIGHETGDLTRLAAGSFEGVKIPGATHLEAIVDIHADAQGHATLLYQSGALRDVKTGAFVESEVAAESSRGLTTSVKDGAGVIWILRAGALSRVASNRVEVVQFDRFAADQQVLGIGPAQDGGVWIATAGHLRKRKGDQWSGEIAPIPWRTTSITSLMEMRDGTVAVATIDQGIWLVRGNGQPFQADRTDGLPPDWVRSTCEDSEGNLWAAFGSGGLAALRPARAKAIGAADRWRARPVLSVAATRNNALWIGTEGAGLYRYYFARCVPFFSEQGPPTNSAVLSFAEDEGGIFWVSTAENGVFVYNGDRFQTAQGLEDFTTPVRALFRSKTHDGLLLGARTGLFKFANQKVEALATNLVLADVRCIAEEKNGTIWFGMFGGGLGKFENGKATQFRKQDGLASDFVQSLWIDPDHGAVWIGTAESGLNRYQDGRFAAVTTVNGLRDNVICHIADDGRGNFWISSHGGIMRVGKADLNRCADGKLGVLQCVSLAETDGLPSAQCSGGLQPTGTRGADGLLWFATLKGIVAIDPEHVRTNQLPIVVIESMRVNDAPISSAKANRAVIEAGRQRFDFDYTAISFAAPERVLFKYRLDGLDSEWVGPTTKRTVSFSHLAPGDYTFRVMACNSDGVWTDGNAVFAFTVLPFFYQTLWFRIVAVVGAIVCVGLFALLIARQRYRRRLELAERQRGIERERARIAQDIHDDLGSSLTRIILLSQSARGDLDSPDIAAKDLDRIYDTARNLTRSLDEIVWAVNPRHDTLDSLATYLGKFAQDFLGAANIRCRLDVPVSLPAWPLTAELRHNVFLAFKEAINNAVKHAQATEVRVGLKLQESAFTLIVEDNGRGFSPEATPKADTDTEDGLMNMRRRLSEVGGSCEIYSRPKQGTRISFHVPIAAKNVGV